MTFRHAVLIVIAGALAVSLSGQVRANWLTHIVREAGEAGGKGAAHVPAHLGPIGKAAAHLKGLSAAPKGALAAHATPEGHWQFTNREGQVFTAGTADELKRVAQTLAPDAGDAKLTLYLSEDSVFANRSALDQIPADADLHLVTDSGALSLKRSGARGAETIDAALKPNLTMTLIDPASFAETQFLLAQRLNKANIRTVALEPGASKALTAAPKIDPASKLPLVDTIDPGDLARVFGAIRGQTVLVTGRVDGGKLLATSASSDVSVELAELASAARASDVNLIVLRNDSGRQAGGRNWLWQKIEVGGLNTAAETATFGDFLDALAAQRGGFKLSAAPDGTGRIQLSAVPTDAGGLVTDATNTLQDLVGNVVGDVATTAVDVFARDRDAQTERDARLIPGIPTYIQFPYLAGIIAGVLGWATTRGWWLRLWPVATDGRSLGLARRLTRELAYWLLFLPIVGFPAFFWQVVVQLWATVTAPFRWFRRKFLAREA